MLMRSGDLSLDVSLWKTPGLERPYLNFGSEERTSTQPASVV